MLGLICALAERCFRRCGLRLLYGEFPRPLERRLAPDDGDLVLLHQELDAAIEALHDAARTLDDSFRIERNVVRRQAVVLGMLHVVIDFRRTQQRLGRNATPIVAYASEIGLFHDRGLEAKLRGADRGDITTGAGADDDDVE